MSTFLYIVFILLLCHIWQSCQVSNFFAKKDIGFDTTQILTDAHLRFGVVTLRMHIDKELGMTKQRERLDIRTNREYMTIDTLLHGFKKRGLSYKKSSDGYSKKAASLFIELILCGLPTPLIIFKELIDGSLAVRLGDTQVEVIHDFFDDKFPLESLELLSGLNGKTFSELPPLRRSLFEDYKLHVISVQPPTPNDVLEHLVEQTASNLGGLYRPLKSITGSL